MSATINNCFDFANVFFSKKYQVYFFEGILNTVIPFNYIDDQLKLDFTVNTFLPISFINYSLLLYLITDSVARH